MTGRVFRKKYVLLCVILSTKLENLRTEQYRTRSESVYIKKKKKTQQSDIPTVVIFGGHSLMWDCKKSGTWVREGLAVWLYVWFVC